MKGLVLASTSTYRRELLARLGLEFQVWAPETDESPLADEIPARTAERLALAKARAVGSYFPNSLIIGSDQVAFIGQLICGKPGTRDRARTQLKEMSGQEVIFHTGLCVLDSETGNFELTGLENRVGFRTLTDADIERYLDREDALNCAGSAKSEGLGVSLLRYNRGDDPSALIGLPLITLCSMLRRHGVLLP